MARSQALSRAPKGDLDPLTQSFIAASLQREVVLGREANLRSIEIDLDELNCTLDLVQDIAKFPLPIKRDMWVGREHFDIFRELVVPEFSKKTTGTAFNSLVQQLPLSAGVKHHNLRQRSLHTGPPNIAYPGLAIKSREQAGLPHWVPHNLTDSSRQLARYALQVDGLLSVASSEAEQDNPAHASRFVMAMGEHLLAYLG